MHLFCPEFPKPKGISLFGFSTWMCWARKGGSMWEWKGGSSASKCCCCCCCFCPKPWFNSIPSPNHQLARQKNTRNTDFLRAQPKILFSGNNNNNKKKREKIPRKTGARQSSKTSFFACPWAVAAPGCGGWENPWNEGEIILENHRNSQHFHENSNWCSKTWEIQLGDGTGMGFFNGWGIQGVFLSP